MKVLIVSPFFPPEPITSAMTSGHLAIGLVDQGHEVTAIVAFPSRPGGRFYAGVKPAFRKVERQQGFTLIRSYSVPSRKSAAISRLIENVTFGITSTLNAMTVRPDVIYSNSWPIFASYLISLMARVRRIPIVVSIQDIHPEAAIALGKLPRGGPLIWLMRRIDTNISRHAARLVTISENFADFYEEVRGILRDRIRVVYNWMDEDDITPGEKAGEFRAKMGIPKDVFVAMYAGNVGAVSSVETIVAAATELRERKDIVFIIAGDGNHRGSCETRVRELGLTNVRFVCPLHELGTVQAAADVMLLPTHRTGATTSVPSKMIAYMCSARPIVAAVHPKSDTARVIREAQCGFCTPPEDAKEMSRTLVQLASSRKELDEIGKNARRYAELHFSRKNCVQRLIAILEEAAGQQRASNGTKAARPYSMSNPG